MKKILIIISILTVTFGCRQSQPKHILVEIDTLLTQHQNNIAYERLVNSDRTDFSQADSAYYDLLMTIVMYRLYMPIATDSVITHSIDVFKKANNNTHLANAYYYRGCIREEYLGDVINGIKDVQTTERIADKTGLKTVSLKASGLLSYLNYSSKNYELATQYANTTLQKARLYNNGKWTGFAYQMLDVIYDRLGAIDSSNFYAMKSEPYAKFQEKHELYAYYLNIGEAYMSQNELDKAEHYLTLSIKNKEYAETYGALADLYALKNYDKKAEEYWKKSLDTPDLYLRSRSLKKYSDWLKKKGRFTDALLYAQELIALNDTLVKEERKQIRERFAQTKYEENRQINDYKYNMTKAFAVIITIIFICIAFIMQLRHSKRRIANTEAQLNEYENIHDRQKALIEKLKSEGEEHSIQAQKLQNQLDNMTDKYHYAMHRGEQNYKKISSGENTATWTKEDFIYFIEYYKSSNPEFINKHGDGLQSVTTNQRFLLCLLDMNMADWQICEILGISRGSLRTARSRIRTRLNKKKK